MAADRRIVVGVDGSGSSQRALAWAARQGELTGATLDVVIAWEWPISSGAVVPILSGWDPKAEAQKRLDETVDAVRAAHPAVTVRARTVEGHPAPVLVEASADAELLVVGSRGYGEFAGMLLGSVSEHCVTHAHCPVVVVRGDSS